MNEYELRKQRYDAKHIQSIKYKTKKNMFLRQASKHTANPTKF